MPLPLKHQLPTTIRAYSSSPPAAGKYFARAFGAMLTALAFGYTIDSSSTLLTSLYGAGSALLLPLTFVNYQDGSGSFAKGMWLLQLWTHIPITTLLLVGEA